MATVIDALVMTLALDPSAFIKGQKEAGSSFKKTKDEAVKNASDMERANTKAADSFGKITASILELTAIVTGGKTFKDFIEGAVKANNAVGMLGTSLGQSPDLIGAWGVAAQRMGGSAASAQASIKSLSDQLTDFRTMGKALPTEMFMLAAKSGVSIDYMHGVERLMVTSAAAAKELAKTDPAAANRYLAAMGLDPATAARMIQQGANIKAYINEQKKLVPSEKDRDAARSMTDAQGKLSAAYDLLAAKIMTALTPALTWFAEKLEAVIEAVARWVEKNPELTAAIVGFFTVMSGALAISALASIASLASGLMGLSTIGMGSGLMAFLARGGLAALGIGAIGATAADAYEHSSLNAGEDERARHRKYSGNDALRRRGSNDSSPIGDIGTAPITNERLAASRKSLMDELNNNAQLRRDVIKTASMENNGSPLKMQAVIESMVNRSGMKGYHSLDQAIHSGFYGPVNQGGLRGGLSAKDRADGEKALSAVAAGGNIIGYRTDQGMLSDPGARRYMQTPDKSGWAKIHGENFFYMGDEGKQWARGQINADNAAPSTKSPSAWAGGLGGARSSFGAPHAAALNNISNSSHATTSTSSNAAHIGTINVNAPSTSDAHSVGRSIDKALADSLFAQQANFGPS